MLRNSFMLRVSMHVTLIQLCVLVVVFLCAAREMIRIVLLPPLPFLVLLLPPPLHVVVVVAVVVVAVAVGVVVVVVVVFVVVCPSRLLPCALG